MKELIRENIRQLQPYSSARDDFKGSEGIFLDANENPYGSFNRYPDPYQTELKQALAIRKRVQTDQIFIGNGSDEVIDLLFRLFCEPGKDEILVFPPTYGMYAVSAAINNISIQEIPLTDAFQLDQKAIQAHLKQAGKNLKLCFVCSPNNPTGNCIHEIDWLCEHFPGIVIVDEAYIDFSNHSSMVDQLHRFPKLVVTQTFSKAWALASARVGVAYASSEMVHWLNKIKPPYNVSTLNQKAALNALENQHKTQKQVATLIEQRDWLKEQLLSISFVEHVYPSEANFLLFKVDDASARYKKLIDQQLVIRNRTSLVDNCLRVTVGTPSENKTFINTLNQM